MIMLWKGMYSKSKYEKNTLIFAMKMEKKNCPCHNYPKLSQAENRNILIKILPLYLLIDA